ncbi:hypothetical protein BDV93DRAFT_610082 [Ceratobasidium sp. AG-I]|nr:hypothetical protein BDV93DRAFT_610082 [Ceratobasidium sp. AG-I]
MAQDDARVVWLSNLRLAGFNPIKKPQTGQTEGVSDKNVESGIRREEASPLGTYPQHREASAYDQLAADKPGEELTPEATIWKLYVAEAKEYDNELVEREHRNIDVMLVFAALFSAILTAFLLDSKNLMRADPADATTLLLTRIAQRLEDPSAAFRPVEIPAFEPTVAAQWINGLWFASLGLSLAAALLAMMAKEWLTTFAASRPRPAHSFAIERQARLDALSSWGALQMIDHLPLFLHVALLLFSLGLMVYLYSLVDLAVATVIALLTGATILFYVIATGLASLYEACPFDTQLSHYCRKLLRFISHRWGFAQRYQHYFNIKRPESIDHNSKEDLHALRWLANHARDPRVSDSAYQALAGLRLKLHSDPPTLPPDSPTAELPILVSQAAISSAPRKMDKLISNMFVEICHRLHQTRAGNRHELAISFGTNAARYILALPNLLGYLHTHPNQERMADLAHARMVKVGARSAVIKHEQYEAFDPARQALDALDAMLADDLPPFSADAYAWITAAELMLTVTIASAIKPHESAVSSKIEHGSESPNEIGPTNAVVLNTSSGSPTLVTLVDLRARYSRSLARASFQMIPHSDGRAPMKAPSLVHLLKCIDTAAQCPALNPPNSLSTHHPQHSYEDSTPPTFCIMMAGATGGYGLSPGVIGDPDGILGGLLNILGASGDELAVERAAGHALSSIAPVLIRQWLNLPSTSADAQNQGSDDSSEVEIPFGLQSQSSDIKESDPASRSFQLSLDTWPTLDGSDSDYIAVWVLTLLLQLSAIAKLHSHKSGVGVLYKLGLQAFNRRSRSCNPDMTPLVAASQKCDIVKYLVASNDNEPSPTKDGDSINGQLLELLALKDRDNATIFSICEIELPHVFQVIHKAPISITRTEILLASISKRGSQNLQHFANKDRGFRWLLQVAERGEYTPAVARCVFDLLSSFSTQHSGNDQSVLSTTEDAHAFLKVVAIALKHPPSRGYKVPSLLLFLQNVFSILQTLRDGEDMKMQIAVDLPEVELEEVLRNNPGNKDLNQCISTGLERFRPKDGAPVST